MLYKSKIYCLPLEIALQCLNIKLWLCKRITGHSCSSHIELLQPATGQRAEKNPSRTGDWEGFCPNY